MTTTIPDEIDKKAWDWAHRRVIELHYITERQDLTSAQLAQESDLVDGYLQCYKDLVSGDDMKTLLNFASLCNSEIGLKRLHAGNCFTDFCNLITKVLKLES